MGEQLPRLRLPSISRATLALFAGASGDHNPIHIDLDAAHAAGLDDVFAHGMLSMAYIGRLLTNWVAQERIRTFTARFVTITPVGAEPTCTGRVTRIADGVATVEFAVTLADGTTTVTGEATLC
ncbi:MaoC/PaaZ C-terminal domain-containing protein [Nocardia amikacinitolerans]|uniref:MaoC/PaaZ C-terminal domain-containing protein n=1 Tax=Nocardia amikacinitolerans TaxID=756689 RepID=UPI00157D1FAB|nr:MaoC/PaaZ C-terminal domain-containing protein [Nocardia amikacinitolerans]